MYNLETIVKGIAGFKISASHFRIGSKIHIADFYYAKRFFQNGFFASRIAFWVARDIAGMVERENRLAAIKERGLTIVGYEMYSELLISLVCIFLRKKWELSELRVNHNLFEDVENLKLCKKNNLLGHVIIVVPIASTFSTAIKIESQIQAFQEQGKKIDILKPHLNIIYVSDGTPGSVVSDLEKGFGWKEKDVGEHVIKVEAYYSAGERDQKYYIALPTKWFLVDDCQLCSRTECRDGKCIEKVEEELPLYETDRTAVTPAIILDYPEGRKIEQEDLERRYILDTCALTYGHHVRNNTHFLYSVDTEYFFEKNREGIQQWLLKIKNSVAFSEIYQDTDRVIIISSCHYSNASFVSLVNDFLFGGSANMIHYEPSNDYVQNFQMVYGDEMRHADKIFFVDDSLKSGASFEKIYRFVQNSLGFDENEGQKKRGICGCFFLINKSQNSTFNNLRSHLVGLKPVYAFANLHLFISLKPYENSLLLFEEERYLKLAEDSFLDSLKIHFKKQANKLSVFKVNDGVSESGNKARKHMKMLVATHRIYQYFVVCGKNPQTRTFQDFYKDVLDKTSSPDKRWDSKDLTDDEEINEDAKDYLKVLTQSPFTQYKLLKDQVFKWCLKLLIEHMKRVEAAIAEDCLTYAHFDSLKFFIRRVGLLNSNILMTETFINFLVVLYSGNGMLKLIQGKNADQDSKIRNFYIFYIAQIKELLLRNESRCLRLERILKRTDVKANPHVMQITRILREENALIIKMFFDHISVHPDWKKDFQGTGKEDIQDIVYDNGKIGVFLDQNSITHHPKFQILDSFFEITGQAPVLENKDFLNYLWVEYFLATDKHKTKIGLNAKTEFIMRKLRQLFMDAGIRKNGAFLIVNDRQYKKFVAYNRNSNETNEIDENEFTGDHIDTDNKYIKNFFRIENDDNVSESGDQYYETIIELGRNEEKKWVNLFAVSDRAPIECLSPSFISDNYNRLLLIRLNKRISGKKRKEVQGLLGFYYHSDDDNVVNIDVIRYLLLLRTSLSNFIERHHENDEFRDWQIANIRQKTSLLTGHGRQMLIDIALTKGERYKDIVYTLLTVQRFIIDKQDEYITDNTRESLIYPGRSNRINQMFRNFFKVTTDELDKPFFDQMEQMAKEIFGFDEIENKDNCQITSVVPGDLSFSFDQHLLSMICFEIFVNAKKNRWLFFPGESISTPDGDYTENQIWMNVEKISPDNFLKIEIANTGPVVSSSMMNRINGKKNIKKYDKYSGIELLDTLLQEFNLGKISFRSERLNNTFIKFIVCLTLKPNSD